MACLRSLRKVSLQSNRWARLGTVHMFVAVAVAACMWTCAREVGGAARLWAKACVSARVQTGWRHAGSVCLMHVCRPAGGMQGVCLMHVCRPAGGMQGVCVSCTRMHTHPQVSHARIAGARTAHQFHTAAPPPPTHTRSHTRTHAHAHTHTHARTHAHTHSPQYLHTCTCTLAPHACTRSLASQAGVDVGARGLHCTRGGVPES